MIIVLLGNAKNTEKMKFHIDAPMHKYCQSALDGFCFRCLASDFDISHQIKSTNTISKCI